MNGREHLVEQHIREYESRQRHVDELLQRAHKHAVENPEHLGDLTILAGKHDVMVGTIKQFKRGEVDARAVQAIEDAGPMGVWFGLVSELETLIERMDA